MKLAEVQIILSQAARLIEAGGGKPGDLIFLSESLEPFKDKSVKQFVADLQEKPTPTPKTPPKKSGNADQLVAHIRGLYERAAAPTTTYDEISAAMSSLDGHTKGDLALAAEAIGLVGMKAKSKAQIITGIRQHIEGRKGAFQRSQLI